MRPTHTNIWLVSVIYPGRSGGRPSWTRRLWGQQPQGQGLHLEVHTHTHGITHHTYVLLAQHTHMKSAIMKQQGVVLVFFVVSYRCGRLVGTQSYDSIGLSGVPSGQQHHVREVWRANPLPTDYRQGGLGRRPTVSQWKHTCTQLCCAQTHVTKTTRGHMLMVGQHPSVSIGVPGVLHELLRTLGAVC